MFVRSPLSAWIGNPGWYYRSVTAHGTTMAYVFPTLVAMGFGYFVTEQALQRPMVGRRPPTAPLWHRRARLQPFISSWAARSPVQLSAYYAAVLKDTDVEQPRNLAKSVTVE